MLYLRIAFLEHLGLSGIHVFVVGIIFSNDPVCDVIQGKQSKPCEKFASSALQCVSSSVQCEYVTSLF
jgi:hypothetical protein